MAAFSTLALIGAGLFAGAQIGKAATQKVPKPPTPEKVPEPPKALPADVTGAVRKQRQMSTAGGRGSTLLTGPSGLKDEAPTQRKTLLGY